MAPTQPSFAAFRAPINRRVFEPGFDVQSRMAKALRKLWLALIALPDRGDAAAAAELPAEYFRFPPF